MSIKATMDDLLKQAIRDNDVKVKNFVRQLRAKVVEHCLSKGIQRDSEDDAVWTQVVLSYRQTIAKALDMLRRHGADDSDLAKTYDFEVEFCARFLPTVKTAEETRQIVMEKARELGAVPAGKLVGAVLKDAAPGTLNPAFVKAAAQDIVG